jgi:hypothetical protein
MTRKALTAHGKSLVGAPVVLARVKREAYRGLAGVVTRYVACSDEAVVQLDDGRTYRAFPANLDRKEEPCPHSL